MIRFLQPVKLEVVSDFDEATETPETSNEAFQQGASVDADIIDEDENRGLVTLQFGDGSVAYNVRRSLFEVA